MIEELTRIIKEINNLEGRIPAHLIDPMFELHNQLFPNNKEFNKGCGTCRGRTLSRLSDYYNKNVLN